jgi:IS30 family transposase
MAADNTHLNKCRILKKRPGSRLLVALRLNQRPRKTLGFKTPASKLQASVASTG